MLRRIAAFIHQQPSWPQFTWDAGALAAPLAQVRHHQGRLLGRMDALGFELGREASFEAVTEDVLRTSEIEGDRLDPGQVRSSVARHLGIERAGLPEPERRINGLVEVLLDATGNSNQPLTAERLWAWQAALFPTGRSGLRDVITGAWRDDRAGPMQVVSGPAGRERVHFEAPAATRIPEEIARLLAWFNAPPSSDPVLKAALAHLWLVTIHPFDDGNGRIARAVSDMAMARSEGTDLRFYSMSAQIRRQRAAYYQILERTQRGSLDVTPWMAWFLDCLGAAIGQAEGLLAKVRFKGQFWQSVSRQTLNRRQVEVLNRLLDGFEGKLTTSKWAKLAHCSTDTALRDITDLVGRGVLRREAAGGRSTAYALAPAPSAP